MRSKGGLFYSDEAVLSRVDAIRDSIMSSFLDDYIFIYYHDIKNNIQTVRFINDHNKTENEKNMEERDDIAETFKYIVDKYVHPEDRETVRDAIVPEKYVPMLRHKKSETIYYRWRYDDRYYLYNRLTIKKLDELDSEPTRVVITCTDVDSQVRERLMLQEIHKRYVSGVNALSREYTSVYYVNLDTKELAPFDISNRIHGLFGDRFYHIDYDRAIEEYVDNAVIDEDKERMSQILSRDYIRRNLINQDYFTRVYLNNENCYCEMKCVKVPQEDASNVVVMGFAVKDEEIRTWQKHKEQKDFQLSLLDGLTRDYHTVFLVKPGNIAELYRVTADRYSDEYLKYREAYSKGFTEGVNFYVDNYVADEDKERLRSEMVFDDLVKKVPDKGVYSITYKRNDDKGGFKYIRICVSKAVSANGECNLVVGFRDVDNIVRNEIRIKTMYEDAVNERDLDGLTGLCNRYCYEHRIGEYKDRDFSTVSCVYIDADGLHELNNEKGHEQGDRLIKAVAEQAVGLWGSGDIFRIGGDEFVAFVFNTDEDQLKEDIGKIKTNLKAEGYSVSIGYDIRTKADFDIRALVKKAEDRMFAEKKEHYQGENDRRHQ